MKSLQILLCCLFLTACGSKPDTAAEKPAPPPRAPNEVFLTTAQMQAAGIELGTFTRRDLGTEVQATGQIDVPPSHRVSVTAIMGGYVERLPVLPGQHVARGSVLATLRHPDYLKLQQDYLQSQARIVFLKQETARQQTLTDEDVGARRKLQQATSELRTEQAAAGSLAAQLRLIGLRPAAISAGNIRPSVALTAPIGGYVKAVLVNPGQFVNPQDVLIELVDRSDLHLELKVFERDIAKVKEGQDILFRVPAQGPDARPLPATIFLVGKAFDDGGHTVSIHAHLHETGPDAAATAALLPGQYVSARILTGRTPQRTLPEDALVPGGEVSYAYYQVKTDAKGSTFRRFSLRPGATDQGQVAVRSLDKLADTTHLVVKGAYFIDAERSKGQGGDE
ncbi:efflux RND transporter periplasmic adaptor subunit [Hymenobacter sp. BT770]|uniref:efflux RND transporter periplasmic adaptor subunit n=1 Tax=Hymenobacter sp. BT770 TaxID=2886942 RepID=UPI001D11F72F|nr:efflux RND transporter periplasmic adaptor subunit [Hymenobacter sp. BT770]MCC3155283.1 efflux RND transporter periplasmic adaptor subunit [Hymenobacter sp. BT770]MDO3417252.1 efflux RND transporter periplasmic adaptor subunit [Hymenobacter sp. BT770]